MRNNTFKSAIFSQCIIRFILHKYCIKCNLFLIKVVA